MTDPQTPRYVVIRPTQDVWGIATYPDGINPVLLCDDRATLTGDDAARYARMEHIAVALNTAEASSADYLDLFAAYHSVKREYSYALSAVDVLKDENMILRELAHCVYMFRDAAGRAEAYPGEHLAVKRQLWGAHDRWLGSQKG